MARIGERLARALHAAHSAGLVHRDVKPSNVVVRADGEPVLLDFGLAADSTESGERLTRSGTLLGSPAYLAPECVEGRPATASTDVYSLGISLFEAMTGGLPFVAPTREALFNRILRAPLPDACARNRGGVPAALASVLRAAMARRPEERYASAQDLADDLAAFLEGRGVSVRELGPAARALAWVRGNPLLSAFLALLGVGLASTALLLGEVTRALERMRALGLADASAAAEPELGVLLGLEAVALLENSVTVSRLQAAVARYHPRIEHPAQDDLVLEVAALANGDVISRSASGHAIRSDASGAERGTLEGVTGLFTEGESVLVELAGGWRRWAGGALESLADPDDAPIVGPASGGRILAVSQDRRSRVVRAQGETRWLRSGSPTDFEHAELVATFDRDASRFLFVPPGDRLALLERNQAVRIHDRSGALLATIPAHGVYVEALAVSPRGDLLASGGGDGVVRLSTVDGAFAGELFGHRGHVKSLAFSPDGETIVTGSYDRGVRAFAVRPGSEHLFHGSLGPVLCVDSAADSMLWVDGGADVWIAQIGGPSRVLARGIARASFIEDGSAVFALRPSGEYVVLDLAGGVRESGKTLPGAARIEDLDAGEGWVLAARRDGRLQLWKRRRMGAARALPDDLAAATPTWSSADPLQVEIELQAATRGPDGRLYCAGRGGLVVVLDAEGAELARFRAHDDWISSIRLAPDGRRLLTTSRDNRARLWTTDGGLIAELADHEATVSQGAFSPDGTIIATASTDRTVRLWNSDGAVRAVLRGHAGQVWDVDFSEDGAYVLSCAYDRHVRRWPVETAKLVETARRLVRRSFTDAERASFAEHIGDYDP
jgi:WD40 repeat protein